MNWLVSYHAVIICGDLNSRTGVMNGKDIQIPAGGNCVEIVEETYIRCVSTEGIVNDFGRYLLNGLTNFIL